jgi:glycerol-3-phosphate acyltransferase PlsY
VLIGHCYRSGCASAAARGVATFFGIAFALWWPIGPWRRCCGSASRRCPAPHPPAGLAAANGAPLVAHLLGQADLAYFFLAAALLIDWKHRANIVRLAKGTEPKIGAAKADGRARMTLSADQIARCG